MRRSNKIKEGRRLVALSSILLCTILIVSIFWINARAELIPTESVTISSEKIKLNTYLPGGVEYNNGAWEITKSAKWIDYGKAQIKFKIDTNKKYKSDQRDLIIAIDISHTMSQDLMDDVKFYTKKFISDHLKKNGQRIALIFFASQAQVMTDFTDDEETLLSYIDRIDVSTTTNYFNAFREYRYVYKSIDTLLSNYDNQNNRTVNTIFVVAGNPTNQEFSYCKAMRNYLKEKYPYLTINAVLYKTKIPSASYYFRR